MMQKVLVFSVFLFCLLVLSSIRSVLAEERGVTESSVPLVVEPKFAFTSALVDGSNATYVHCTNLGADTVTIQIKLYEFSGDLAATSNPTFIQADKTLTFAFARTVAEASSPIYVNDLITVSSRVKQGYGEILVDPQAAPVICEAQVIIKSGTDLIEVIPLTLVPVTASGLPTAVTLPAMRLAQSPTWQVAILAVLVILGAASVRMLRRESHL